MRNRKQQKEAQNIKNILSMVQQQNNVPAVEPPIELKPAIRFRVDTCPSKEVIEEGREMGAFNMYFAKTEPSEKEGEFTLLTKNVNTVYGSILNKIIDVSAGDNLRSIISSSPDRVAADTVVALRNAASSAAFNKYQTALLQIVQYVISDAIKCLCQLLRTAEYNTVADKIMENFEERDRTLIRHHIYIPYMSYLNTLNDIIATDDNDKYDKGYELLFNTIMADISREIFDIINSASNMVSDVLYKTTDMSMGINDATNAYAFFTETLTSAFGNVFNAIVDNTVGFLNDLSLVSQTIYGNAIIDPIRYGSNRVLGNVDDIEF